MENEILTTVLSDDATIYIYPYKITDYLYDMSDENINKGERIQVCKGSALKLNQEEKPYRTIYPTKNGYLALWLTYGGLDEDDDTSIYNLNIYFIKESERLEDDILLKDDEVYCFNIPMQTGNYANCILRHNFVDTTPLGDDYCFDKLFQSDNKKPCFQVDVDKIVSTFPIFAIKELMGFRFANIDFQKVFEDYYKNK